MNGWKKGGLVAGNTTCYLGFMSNVPNPIYSGHCLCGSVSYEVTGAPVIVAQCHCEECRRLSGTGHTIGAMFSKKHFHINGELGEYKYASSKDSEVTKGFCSKCGSPIYGRNTRSPEHITLSLGTMDDANDLAVQVVVFARDKQPWDELNEDAVCFQTQPDWKPDS